VKHTADGAEIGIGGEVRDGVIRCWVRDSGPGIRPEDRHRIFVRFGRADVPEGDEGFGLGLSIVSAIATAHGGRAYVDDPPPDRPRGAMFVVELPVVRRIAELTTEEAPWPAS
jgi:signal transduction histidine kinase